MALLSNSTKCLKHPGKTLDFQSDVVQQPACVGPHTKVRGACKELFDLPIVSRTGHVDSARSEIGLLSQKPTR
jgi:hypothetical protein